MTIAECFLVLLLPASMDCYGREDVKNVSSISGDCITYTRSSLSTVMSVKSSSILIVNKEIHTEYFSGDGYSDSGERKPSITSSAIYHSLFQDDAFVAVFSTVNSAEAQLKVTQTGLRKLELTIKDADRPFIVGQGNLSYFWGPDKLPAESNECVGIQPSNSKRAISYCNITEMDKCSAMIGEVPHLAPFSFLSGEGKRLTHLAWLCPKGKVCCGWECCQKWERIDSTGECAFFVILLSFHVFLLIIILSNK